MNLKGKTVLITGAAQRIGKALVYGVAERGAHVVVHYNRSEKEAQRLKTELRKRRVKVSLVSADLSRTPSLDVVRDLLNQLKKEVGHVDCLINNASTFYPTTLESTREEDLDLFFSVHAKAPFFLARELGKRMKTKKQGKIINLIDSNMGRPHMSYIPYMMSKSALHEASIGLAKALAPYVQVNSIAPGPILAPKGASTKHKKQVTSKTLLKRFGDPKDIVNTALYLIEGTDYVTGAWIPVDGGAHIY